jgi:hypothetical protein
MSKIKSIIVLSLVSTLTFGLSGCTLFGKESNPQPTEEIVVKETIVNPTAQGSSVPVSVVNFDNDVELKVFYVGTGYPTDYELKISETGEGPDTEVKLDDKGNVIVPENTATLVKERRVVALGYTLTNNSESPIKLNSFSWNNPASATTELKTVSTNLSLHNMQGYASVPVALSSNPEAELQPGETATWGTDVILNDDSTGKDKLGLTQIFNLGESSVQTAYIVNAKDTPTSKGKEIKNEQENK